MVDVAHDFQITRIRRRGNRCRLREDCIGNQMTFTRHHNGNVRRLGEETSSTDSTWLYLVISNNAIIYLFLEPVVITHHKIHRMTKTLKISKSPRHAAKLPKTWSPSFLFAIILALFNNSKNQETESQFDPLQHYSDFFSKSSILSRHNFCNHVFYTQATYTRRLRHIVVFVLAIGMRY